ncbi:hypothetical protein N7494_008576 [Penicillium frequentans]|uniref:Uncharacterized protein n=1 Tax=Penicillium frequentans TaxID=3151616 RepID=A0AAD6GCI1_9EURO|nr:hypothetical protein N7494_008576 [Penicillium glabrum]
MTKELVFDVRYVNELAHTHYGDGQKLAKKLMGIYDQYNVEVADSFDSPVSETLMSLVPVSAPDGTTVDDLRMVKVPPGLMIDILDFDMY